MSEEATPQPKKTRTPARTVDQKLSELIEVKRRQVAKLEEREAKLSAQHQAAKNAHAFAAVELARLELALESSATNPSPPVDPIEVHP